MKFQNAKKRGQSGPLTATDHTSSPAQYAATLARSHSSSDGSGRSPGFDARCNAGR